MFCTNCGTELADDCTFCTECGTQLNSITEQKQVIKQTKTNKSNVKLSIDSKYLKVILFSFVTIVVVAGALLVMKKIKSDQDVAEVTTQQEAVSEDRTQTVITEEQTDEASTENVTTDEEKTEETVSKKKPEYTKEFCENTIKDLKICNIVESDVYQTLFEISNVLVNANITTNDGIVLSQISDNDAWELDYKIMKETLYGAETFINQMSWENNEYCGVKDLEQLISELYGGGSVKERTQSSYAIIKDDKLQFIYGFGDFWHNIECATVRCKDDYYLLTAPYFYGDNSGQHDFKGYVDVLFVKNKDSRFGVTILYARTYDNEIKPSKIEATSQLSSQMEKDYAPDNLCDDNLETAWVEGKDDLGIGESFTLYFNEMKEVYGIALFNGYLVSKDLYDKNGKVTKIEIDFGNGIKKEYDIAVYDEWHLQYAIEYTLDEVILTDKITVTIKDAIPGTKYNDVCISELVIY